MIMNWGQLFMTEWNSNNVSVSFNSIFQVISTTKISSGNLQELLPHWTSDCVVYKSQQTDTCISINLDDQMLRKVPSDKRKNVATACVTAVNKNIAPLFL